MSFRPVPPNSRFGSLPGKTWLPTSRPRIRTLCFENVTVIEIHGEADLAAAPALHHHLREAAPCRSACLVVDLRPAGFFDSSVLDLLRDARGRAHSGGGSFALVCTDRWHLRVLRLAGLSTPHPPTSTLGDALAVEQPGVPLVPRLVASPPLARRPVLGARRSQWP
ncbi:STAS domain-containing protein [Streptomyces candidus]|uniref:Anti-anti-sigma factor n=1 Tax=Streptomyces candidus TaxID=67283 RepID=A0A7X0LRW9_9ACTN|nr:STAS domain-containing protein [Streptomyces candidus]MBB6438537.1 anti-anti-sigma factor [Streptomyces candidus]